MRLVHSQLIFGNIIHLPCRCQWEKAMTKETFFGQNNFLLFPAEIIKINFTFKKNWLPADSTMIVRIIFSCLLTALYICSICLINHSCCDTFYVRKCYSSALHTQLLLCFFNSNIIILY
jgi:hypothetical protein